jgi:hypothetical protein
MVCQHILYTFLFTFCDHSCTIRVLTKGTQNEQTILDSIRLHLRHTGATVVIQQYPLTWPVGWKRTQQPTRSRFEPSSVSVEADYLIGELQRLGARGVVISSNMQYRADGMPYARQPNISDTGVAVYFTLNGDEQCIPCDKWMTLAENLRAIWKTIEALRGIERWGAKDMVNAAFRGFKALPESTIVTPYQSRLWYEVLEVAPTASPEVVKAAYRQQLMKHHPDKGGDVVKFHEVQKALKESGVKS